MLKLIKKDKFIKLIFFRCHGNTMVKINLGEIVMNINNIKAQIEKLNLNNFKLIQTKSNSLLSLNSRYKFSDCMYFKY